MGELHNNNLNLKKMVIIYCTHKLIVSSLYEICTVPHTIIVLGIQYGWFQLPQHKIYLRQFKDDSWPIEYTEREGQQSSHQDKVHDHLHYSV